MNIKTISRSYRGESFLYTVGSIATLDRGDGIENVDIGGIIEKANKFVLVDTEGKEFLKITKTENIEVKYK